MGFRANRTVYKLIFDDPDFEGLVVRIRSGSLDERQEFDDITTNPDLFAFFERMLVEWNAEDDQGNTLPLTAAGIRQLEPSTFREIQSAWIRAVREVPTPLEQPSTGGDPSLEASIPMDTPSVSLAS